MSDDLRSGKYNHLLPGRMSHVIAGLQTGLKLAQQAGIERDIKEIEYALRMIDLCEIRYTPEEKRYLDSFAEDCAKYGCD